MTARTLRLPLALCALAVAVTALVGCGTTSATAPVLDDLTQVADRTGEAESASFALTVDQTLGPQTFSLSAEGAFDGKQKRARLSVDLSGLAKLFAGLGPALGRLDGTLQGLDDPGSWKIDVVRAGTKVYVSSPLLAGALPAGKTWVSGDFGKLAKEHGVELGQLGAVGSADPRDLLDLLRGTSGGLEEVGTETLRGVETTHYRATLDPDEVAKLAADNGGARVGDALSGAIEQTGLKDLPIDVWVDSSSRLRRLDATIAATPRGMTSSTAVSLELYGYDEPVEVTVPPAPSVADADELHRP